MHSPCFLMKTRLRRPHLPSGRRQMPFYTQPVFTKNQSARALGIFAAPEHFAASHPRLLADYEDGRVEGEGEHGCFAACGWRWGAVALDGG